jgi:hypothetical protein
LRLGFTKQNKNGLASIINTPWFDLQTLTNFLNLEFTQYRKGFLSQTVVKVLDDDDEEEEMLEDTPAKSEIEGNTNVDEC